MTVRLADGRIVEQNIYPGETHCKYDHHHQKKKMIGDDVKKNENGENNCNDNLNGSFSLLFNLDRDHDCYFIGVGS